MKRERDSQRSKFWYSVYAVQIGPKSDLGPDGRQALYDRIRQDKWLKKTYPRWVPGLTAPRRRSNKAYLLLNTVAYDIVGATYWSSNPKPAHHGWQHAKVFMDLVRRMYGRAKADEVKDAYKARRVRFRPKKKRAPTGLAIPGVMPEAFKANLERVRNDPILIQKREQKLNEVQEKMASRAPVPDALAGLL